MQATRFTDLSCPECGYRLKPERLDGVEVDHCLSCGGTFLDPGEEEVVIGAAAAPRHWMRTIIKRKIVPTTKCCPKDGHLLNECHVVFREERVGVDVCSECGGLWLAPGEGRHLSNIVMAAGQSNEGLITEPPGVGSYLFQLFSGVPLEAWNPISRFPVVTVSLIATIFLSYIVVQGGQVAMGQDVVESWWFLHLTLVPANISNGGHLWTLFTSIFLHADVFHLAGNCFFLYLVGDNTEDLLGRWRYLLLFFAAGLAGSLAQAFLFVMDPNMPTLGASGAVAGIIGAYLVLFPRVKLHVVFFFVRFRLPALAYFALWLSFNAVGVIMEVPGVGWMAHLGGFAAGLLLAYPRRLKSLRDRLKA